MESKTVKLNSNEKCHFCRNFLEIDREIEGSFDCLIKQ